jgi:hypothetical protein
MSLEPLSHGFSDLLKVPFAKIINNSHDIDVPLRRGIEHKLVLSDHIIDRLHEFLLLFRIWSAVNPRIALVAFKDISLGFLRARSPNQVLVLFIPGEIAVIFTLRQTDDDQEQRIVHDVHATQELDVFTDDVLEFLDAGGLLAGDGELFVVEMLEVRVFQEFDLIEQHLLLLR